MERGIKYRNCELESDIQNSFLLYKNTNQFTAFQCKILHRILCTISLLFGCKLKETQHCNVCNETKETILHLFWECNIVKSLWLEMAEILKKNKCNVELPISAQHIILGSDMLDYSINLFIVLIQYYIYSCRFSGQKPCVSGNKYIRERIVKKWEDIKIILV